MSVYLYHLFCFLLGICVQGRNSLCHDYGFNKCSGDLYAQIFELNTGSQAICQNLCGTLPECQFYAFYKEPVQNVDCHLFKEPFSAYINHCQIRIGPPNVFGGTSECLTPEEHTCDIEQSGNCNLFGRIMETNLDTPTVETCQEVCNINKMCKYWEWSVEREVCSLYDSDEKDCGIVFGPGEECTTVPTTSTAPTVASTTCGSSGTGNIYNDMVRRCKVYG